MASVSSTVTSWSMTEYMAVWLVYDTKNHSKKSVWHYTWLRVWHKTWVQFFGKKGKKRVYDTKVYDTKCTTKKSSVKLALFHTHFWPVTSIFHGTRELHLHLNWPKNGYNIVQLAWSLEKLVGGRLLSFSTESFSNIRNSIWQKHFHKDCLCPAMGWKLVFKCEIWWIWWSFYGFQ